jgi:hypothetical protein
MDELVGRNIENLEILRDSGGDTYSVIKTIKWRMDSGVCIEYFKVDVKVKRISETEYWSLKDEDKEFYGEEVD